MADPLRSYKNQMLNYGIGRNLFDNKPVTREQMAEATIPESTSLIDEIKRLQMAGGLSGKNQPIKNKAFESGIEAAIKKVSEAGDVKKGVPSDFVPFDPTTLPNVRIFESTPGSEGPKLVQDLAPPGLGSKSFVDAKENLKEQNQEDFRKTEAALVEMQGGLKSQPFVGQGQDNNPNATGVEEKDPEVRAFMAGMDEFINAARGAAPNAPSVKSIEDYKKVFAEATGLDISGKPDKSSALMSLGLALMQNRAGSGFNVGNILRAVGQAGEVALPKLEAAKKEAKATAASAGKFALEMRSSDQAKATVAKEKAMQRDDYFIIPKVGGGVSGDIAGILSNKGRLEKLNKYELDKLVNNSEFSDKFTILPGATYATVVEEAMKTPEAQDMYLTKNPISFNLLGEGDDKGADVFNIRLYDADPNKNPNGKPMFGGGDGSMQYRALGLAARDLEKAKQKFLDAMPLVEGTNIFRFSVDKIDAAASAFGVNFREDATPTQKLKLFLTKLQAQNAKEILGEAGKTISDADRALVKSIIGDLNGGSTPDELQVKLDGLFNDIIIKKQQKITDAISTLDYYTGRNVSSLLSGGSMSEEDEKERIEGLKKLGINPDE